MKTIMNEKLPISNTSPIKARYYDYQHFTYPWHFHSQYELMYVENGFGQCFVGDSIHKFSDGDLILFGSNLPHYMNSDDSYKKKNSNLRVKGTIVQFEKDFMNYSINNYPQFLQIKTLLENSGRGILFPKEQSDKIKSILKKLPEMNGFQQIINFLNLLQELASCKKNTVLASPQFYKSFPKLGNSRIEKIISFININYTRNISLTEIASLAAMNVSSFCRYFKEQTGKTFLEYIAEMRIGYACKLLTLNEKSINQISIECGFESITHFNKTFKKQTHFTPTIYKQKILENTI